MLVPDDTLLDFAEALEQQMRHQWGPGIDPCRISPVQIVTGYAEAGSALVGGGVGKVIFVGSTAVGKKVMAAAAENLTPVVLELGG